MRAYMQKCSGCGTERIVKYKALGHRSGLCRPCSQTGNKCAKGAVRSEEYCRNVSIRMGGDGDVLNRKYPGLSRWTRLVKERDGHKCAECGYQGTDGKKDVDAHHVIPKASHPELATVLFNGVTLCKPCHKELHKCKA